MKKAELHCHLEGAAEPQLVLRLAKKYGLDMSGIIKDGAYQWNDFSSFLKCYDTASRVFRQPADYRLLTYDYFSRLTDQDAIYGEVFASPDHAAEMGIGYADLIDAVSDGIDDAEKEFGIEGRIIVTCVRHLGAEAAESVADLAASSAHPKVTGFGMAGDERAFAVEDFSNAFSIASDAGLGLTAHAGEFAGPQSVRDALDFLGVTRIGHGVRAIEDPALVERLVEEEVVLEACPGSNIALGVYSDFAAHPLSKLADAGVRLTLNSDDPPYFHTTLAHEYENAASHFRMGEEQLSGVTRTAIEAAFVDEPTRLKLLKTLDNVV